MAELRTIVGIRETKNKTNGNYFYNYYYIEDFSDYEKDTAEQCVGKKVGYEGSSIRFDVQVGDKVKMYYEKGYQDKAFLSELVVKEKAKTSSSAN